MSYGKAGRGLAYGGTRYVAQPMTAPSLDRDFTRAAPGVMAARAGFTPRTSALLWGSVPLVTVEGHEPDPFYDVRKSGLGAPPTLRSENIMRYESKAQLDPGTFTRGQPALIERTPPPVTAQVSPLAVLAGAAAALWIVNYFTKAKRNPKRGRQRAFEPRGWSPPRYVFVRG